MADLTSSLNVSFNEDEIDGDEDTPLELGKNYSFVLEEDQGGRDLFRPASAFIQMVSGVQSVNSQQGITNVRLYSPKSASLKVFGTYGGGIQSIGMRQDTIREVLTFSGSKTQTLSKGYGIASGIIIDKTAFYNKDGFSASMPIQKGRGLYEASEEVYGSLVVAYSPLYYLYRVSYAIPSSVILDMAATGKTLSEYSLLPITVLAFATGGYGATLGLSRRFNTQVEEPECTGHWEEVTRSRKVKEVKIYDDADKDVDGNPIPDANYVRIEKIIELTEQCSNNPDVVKVRRYNE